MLQHLQLLNKIDLSVILALRSLFPWELGTMELFDGLQVIEEEDGRRVILDAHVQELVSATINGDLLTITAHERLDDCNHQLAIALQALGMGTRTYGIDAEVGYDRVLSLDGAWCLLRTLKTHKPGVDPVAAAKTLLVLAHEWNEVRQSVFDGTATQRQIQRMQEIEQLCKDQKALGPCSAWSIHHDPRGSSLQYWLKSPTEQKEPSELCALPMNWKVANPLVLPLKAVAASKSPYLPTPTKIGEEVLAVLANLDITTDRAVITNQLSPKIYAKVNEVLEQCGAHWDRFAQAHVFVDGDPSVLELAIETGELLTDKDYEFFPTPPELINELILKLNLDAGMQGLEPNAGNGALAMAAAEIVGKSNITCYELMPRNCAALRKLGFAVPTPVDFLQVPPEPKFDFVVMNPPFSGGRDIVHVQHAFQFLKPGGRLAAITSTQWKVGKRARDLKFRAFVDELALGMQEIKRGAFHQSGTDVPTMMLVLEAPAVRPQEVKPGVQEDYLTKLQAAFTL